jgi:hypothetical protein
MSISSISFQTPSSQLIDDYSFPVKGYVPAFLPILPTLFYNVLEFCSLNDIRAVEITTKYSHLAIQSIWIKFVAQRNLFTFALNRTTFLEDSKAMMKTTTINVHKLYQNEILATFFVNKTTEEKNKQNASNTTATLSLDDEADIPILSQSNNDNWYSQTLQCIVEANNAIIRKHTQTTISKSLHLSPLDTYIERRCNPWKNIYFQIRTQESDSPLEQPNSVDEFTQIGIERLYQAQKHAQGELFTLLQNFLVYQSSLSPEHSHFNLLQILRQVQDNNPKRLEIMIAALKVDATIINKTISEEILSQAGTSPEVQNTFKGKTLLRCAVELAKKGNQTERYRKLKVVSVLIAAKANIAEPGIMKYAVTHGSVDLVSTLLKERADPNQIEEGRTLLEQALCHSSPLRNQYDTQSVLSTLFAAKADVNALNSLGETVLMSTVKHCSFQMFHFFKQMGPNLSKTDPSGRTALMHAVSIPGGIKKINALIATRMFSVKLDGEKTYNCTHVIAREINQRDYAGRTPLMLAAAADHPEVQTYVQTLLEAKADAEIRDNKGNTAFSIACQNELPDAITSLLRPKKSNVIVLPITQKSSKPQESNVIVLPTRKRKEIAKEN